MSVTRVILPKLGLTMDEGRIVAWRKREGDRVTQGEILFEVETDKATMEVEAPAGGVLRRILVNADATAPVASLIAFISDTPDEALPDATADAWRATPPPTPPEAAVTHPPEPAASASAEPERVRSSPAARKRAQELGVEIGLVRGSGPDGRVTLEDVEAASSGAAPAPSSPTAPARPRVSEGQDGERREPLSRMRRAIADRMSRSWREAPQFSVSRDVDMTSANVARKKAGASYTDVIVAAAAKALARHPRLRARFDGDALASTDGVHIGIAVAVEDGLLVPVLRDADKKDLATLAMERERLEQHAHAGKLTADEMTGGVFSVSNLGTLGVDRFTAIVNPPEAAILAVGRVSDRVVAQGGEATVRPVATLTLSVDHRVADGAAAARFLDDIAKVLEESAV